MPGLAARHSLQDAHILALSSLPSVATTQGNENFILRQWFEDRKSAVSCKYFPLSCPLATTNNEELNWSELRRRRAHNGVVSCARCDTRRTQRDSGAALAPAPAPARFATKNFTASQVSWSIDTAMAWMCDREFHISGSDSELSRGLAVRFADVFPSSLLGAAPDVDKLIARTDICLILTDPRTPRCVAILGEVKMPATLAISSSLNAIERSMLVSRWLTMTPVTTKPPRQGLDVARCAVTG